MSNSVPVATVFGGSGFVGRYVCQRLAKAGWRVRVAVRRPDEAGFVRTYGTVGQVEPVQANIRDSESTRNAIVGADAVVNCVGILVASGKQRFDTVVAEGAARIARLTAEAGVRRLVHISAIGADVESASAYARSKGEAEAAVIAAFPDAVILRPSVVFGAEDEFFNRFGGMARMLPVIPLVGAETRFQPVWVDDVAAAAVKAVVSPVNAGIYELGGPEVASFRQLIERMLKVIGRKRFVAALPQWAGSLNAGVLSFFERASLGLFTNNILTADQLILLEKDNVVSGLLPGFAEFGIKPAPLDSVIGDYLYCYRPHGQYDEMTASAADLR